MARQFNNKDIDPSFIPISKFKYNGYGFILNKVENGISPIYLQVFDTSKKKQIHGLNVNKMSRIEDYYNQSIAISKYIGEDLDGFKKAVKANKV